MARRTTQELAEVALQSALRRTTQELAEVALQSTLRRTTQELSEVALQSTLRRVTQMLGEAALLVSSLPLSENFTGTNGAAWNNDNWVTSAASGGGSVTIQTNRGRESGTAGVANSGGRAVSRKGGRVNQEVTGDLQLCDTTEPCRIDLWLRASGDWTGLDTPTDGYGVRLPADSSTAQLIKSVAGVETVLASATWPRDLVLKSWRFQTLGVNIRFRIWNQADAEPTTWLFDVQDSSTGGVGVFQVAYVCPTAPTGGTCADYDNIGGNDLYAALGSASPRGTASGTVVVPSVPPPSGGTGESRPARAVRRRRRRG